MRVVIISILKRLCENLIGELMKKALNNLMIIISYYWLEWLGSILGFWSILDPMPWKTVILALLYINDSTNLYHILIICLFHFNYFNWALLLFLGRSLINTIVIFNILFNIRKGTTVYTILNIFPFSKYLWFGHLGSFLIFILLSASSKFHFLFVITTFRIWYFPQISFDSLYLKIPS